MFAVIVIAIAIVVITRLRTVIRHDRPMTTPRSHSHEVDPHSARLLRVL